MNEQDNSEIKSINKLAIITLSLIVFILLVPIAHMHIKKAQDISKKNQEEILMRKKHLDKKKEIVKLWLEQRLEMIAL